MEGTWSQQTTVGFAKCAQTLGRVHVCSTFWNSLFVVVDRMLQCANATPFTGLKCCDLLWSHWFLRASRARQVEHHPRNLHAIVDTRTRWLSEATPRARPTMGNMPTIRLLGHILLLVMRWSKTRLHASRARILLCSLVRGSAQVV